MADVFYADGFAWAATAAQVNESALVVVGDGVSSLAADVMDVGGQQIVCPAGRGVIFPCDDPGTSYVIHMWMRGGGAVSSARIYFRLTNGVGDATFSISQITGGGANNTLRFLHKGSLLYTQDSASTNAHYQIEIVEHPSAGSIRILRNGVETYFDDAVDTSRAFAFDRILLGCNSTGGGTETRFTHPIVASEPLGHGAVVQYFPVTSDEGPNEMTRNTGATDFEALEDVPNDGDTSYVRSEDAGDRTTHKALISGLEDRAIVAAQAHSTQRLEVASDDRLAYRLDGMESIREGVGVDEYSGRGGDWHSEDSEEDPWSEASLSDAVMQIEHLAPEA